MWRPLALIQCIILNIRTVFNIWMKILYSQCLNSKHDERHHIWGALLGSYCSRLQLVLACGYLSIQLCFFPWVSEKASLLDWDQVTDLLIKEHPILDPFTVKPVLERLAECEQTVQPCTQHSFIFQYITKLFPSNIILLQTFLLPCIPHLVPAIHFVRLE